MHENEALIQLFSPEELPKRYGEQTGGDFNVALLRLLAVRTERYTMSESSSVTVEMAQELLESIRFTLALGCEAQGHSLAELPTGESLPALLLAGQAEAERRVKVGQMLLKHANALLSDIDDPALQETLAGWHSFLSAMICGFLLMISLVPSIIFWTRRFRKICKASIIS